MLWLQCMYYDYTFIFNNTNVKRETFTILSKWRITVFFYLTPLVDDEKQNGRLTTFNVACFGYESEKL